MLGVSTTLLVGPLSRQVGTQSDRRVIVLGIDGMDPAAARQLLARLAAAIETRTRLYDALACAFAGRRNGSAAATLLA